MAQKPDGKPAKTEKVAFTRPAAERISKVVRTVELGNRDCGPMTFGSGGSGAASAKVFRVCTFTGSWSINAIKTVTFKNQTSTPNTVSATNVYAGLNAGTVSIAKEGTAWYVVGADLTTQRGYSSSGTQVLTVSNGLLLWMGTTACS
jgi:hypothetical protein